MCRRPNLSRERSPTPPGRLQLPGDPLDLLGQPRDLRIELDDLGGERVRRPAAAGAAGVEVGLGEADGTGVADHALIVGYKSAYAPEQNGSIQGA